MNENTTVVTLKIGANAWSNIYSGVSTAALGDSFDTLLTSTTEDQGMLYIQNSNGDQALDSSEKGYLVISLSGDNAALVRSQVTVEVRLEKSAPLTLEFTILHTELCLLSKLPYQPVEKWKYDNHFSACRDYALALTKEGAQYQSGNPSPSDPYDSGIYSQGLRERAQCAFCV